MEDEFQRQLSEALARVRRFKGVLEDRVAPTTSQDTRRGASENSAAIRSDALYIALREISEPLAASYEQVRSDLQDPERTSWAGTAHEIREVMATLLRLKAPDAEVVAASWYKAEPNTSGPTQKHRVRYILQQQGAGSKQKDVVGEISLLEEKVGDLVRATYSRASDAAHRMKGRTEARRLLRYFEAFMHDLLNLE